MNVPRAPLALAHFRRCAGMEASHLAFAPGRINFMGDYTDFNDGFVLPMAIREGIYAAARPRLDGLVRIWGPPPGGELVEFPVKSPGRDAQGRWSNYARGVYAGMAAAGMALPGCDVALEADLPPGSGLSSSAALEIVLATLGESLAGMAMDPVQKALLCQKAEHDYAGTPCGIMDQFAVTFGKQGHLLLIDCASLKYELVPMRSDGTTLLAVNTRVRHALNDGAYAARQAECDEAARLLGVSTLRQVSLAEIESGTGLLPEKLYRRARHVASENLRTLAAVEEWQRGDWTRLGELMYASHASLRDDMNVSCAELDFVVEAARMIGETGGVFGCRMTGGGFGGCCVVLVQTAKVPEISLRLESEYRSVHNITPHIFVTKPSDGASVLMAPTLRPISDL